jgi:GTP cyclohydrolase I
MKLRTSNIKPVKIELDEILDHDHVMRSVQTPMRADAFRLNESEKIEAIEHHFTEIMKILGLDLSDDSLKDTPARVAKMYVREIFSGLNPDAKPSITLFDNSYRYNEMILEKNIRFHSQCEHHFVPFFGVAHVAYISSGKIIGLSKLNRLVHYYSKRPQVQERLTIQIAEDLKNILGTEDVAVMLEAEHLCVASRGIKDIGSSTITTSFHGSFKEEIRQSRFLQFVKD